jgi:hypothetical protein
MQLIRNWQMTEEEKEFLWGLEVSLFTRIHNDAERHYQNCVFTPRFKGDTFFDKYISFMGKDDYEDWQKLQAFIIKYS